MFKMKLWCVVSIAGLWLFAAIALLNPPLTPSANAKVSALHDFDYVVMSENNIDTITKSLLDNENFLDRLPPKRKRVNAVKPPKLPTGVVTEFSVLDSIISPTLTKSQRTQIHCMARNIYHEAGNQDFLPKLAVANVTLKRKDSSYYPDTFCDVVSDGYKPGKINGCQFSWFCNGKPDDVILYSTWSDGKKHLNKKEYYTWVESVTIANDIFNGVAPNIVGEATNYYNPNICYKWSVRVDKAGNVLTAKNNKDLINRVIPNTVACHPKWGYNGLQTGRFVKASTKYAPNGMVGDHLFLVDTHKIQLASTD